MLLRHGPRSCAGAAHRHQTDPATWHARGQQARGLGGARHVARSSLDAVQQQEQQQQQPQPGDGARVSLVPETLAGMADDVQLQQTMAALAERGQAALTREEAARRRRALAGRGLPSFGAKLQAAGCEPLSRGAVTTLQLNIGLYCNQACSHCHVESSPARTEMMDRATADRCLQLLADSETVTCLDITGGAPELNSQFRHLVECARGMGPLNIIDRCNLTVLCEPGQEDLPAFLAQHKVRVVASLPCYGQANTDKQRGRGVFDRSIQGLKLLNALGYGKPGSGLTLDLVFNPGGAFLAPPQATLEPAYKAELQTVYGIEFNSLLCLNNMPIKRFADTLLRDGALDDYMATLVHAFNPAAVAGLMCRNTLSVAWDGRLYDCDFNQQLELPLALPAAQQAKQPQRRGALTVWDVDSLAELSGARVAVDSHCFGCTAGSGSGCGGQA